MTSQQHSTLVAFILKVSSSTSVKLFSPDFHVTLWALLSSPLRILFPCLTQKCQCSSVLPSAQCSHFMQSPSVTSQGCICSPDLSADLQVFILTFHSLGFSTGIFSNNTFRIKLIIFSMATSDKTKTKSLCWE